MGADDLHAESWSFARGNRALAPDFSIVVPDGWNVFEAAEDDERVFKAYPDGVTQADIDDGGEYSMDGIFYCEMPGMTADDAKEVLQDHGINEFVRAMVRFLRDGDANPTSSAATKVRFVKGKNCYVMVSRVDTNAGISSMFGELGSSLASLQNLLGSLSGEEQPGGYDIQIIPCMPFSNNYIRLYCPNQSGKYADDAFDKACGMAQSVELADPLVCDVIADFEKCKRQKVDAQFFCDTENKLINTLGASRELERKAADQRFVREAKQIVAQGGEIPSINAHAIEFFSDFANRTTGYAFDLLEAYRFQKEQGASEEDLQRMIDAIGKFMTLYEMILSGSDSDDQAEIDALGNIRKPDGYEELRNLIEAECPGYKKKHDAEREEKLAEADDSSESDQTADAEERASENAGGYGSWWAPFPDDCEPYYGGFNQKFDHNAACWLLYQDRIFFDDDEISWDGHHHALAGMQVNAAYADQIPVFMERSGSYAPAFGDFMMAIEQDEGLIVPRDMIHPVTQNALREGDLTGITLLNLQACAMSLMIASTAPHQYNVFVEPRVLGGIPDFLNLMGRLIWDMREYNDVEAPFSVTLLGTRSAGANVFFGDDGFLGKPVAGATTELAATFNSKPTVTLPTEEAIKTANHSFASGFDNPEEMQADESLFETSLTATMRDFPLTVAIEGTRYLGRAQRIEDIEVGDKLVLASDWNNKWFTPCCIEVFNDKGETLGNLNEQLSISMSGNRELALLLPYVTATVESVTPLSKRRKNAKHALLDVHIELDESVKPEEFAPADPAVVSKAREMLRLPKAERITMSKSQLTLADLKGTIDTSSMKSPDGSASAAADSKQDTHATEREDETRGEEERREAEERARKEEAGAKQEGEAARKAADEKKKSLIRETPDEREARIKLMIIDSVARVKKLKDVIINEVLLNKANGRYECFLEKKEVTKCFDELCSQDKLSITWGMRWTSTYSSSGMVDGRYRWHLEHVGEIPDDVKGMDGLERAKLAHEEAMHQYESIQNNTGDGKWIITDSGWEGEIVDAILKRGGGVTRDVMVADATRVLRGRGSQGTANIETYLDGLESRKIVIEKGGLYYLWTQHGVDGQPMKDDFILVDEIEKLHREREFLEKEAASVDAASVDIAKQYESVEALESKVRSFGFFGGGAEKKKAKAALKQAKARLMELQTKLERAKVAKGKLDQCEKAIKEKSFALERNKSRYRWY